MLCLQTAQTNPTDSTLPLSVHCKFHLENKMMLKHCIENREIQLTGSFLNNTIKLTMNASTSLTKNQTSDYP